MLSSGRPSLTDRNKTQTLPIKEMYPQMDSTDTTAALGSLKKDHKNSQIIHRNSSELNGNSRKQSA